LKAWDADWESWDVDWESWDVDWESWDAEGEFGVDAFEVTWFAFMGWLG